MSLLRLPLLISATAAFHAAATPPHPPASTEERQKFTSEQNMSEIAVRLWPFLYKMSFWACGLTEAATILAMRYPASPLSQAILKRVIQKPQAHNSLVVTSGFLAGWTLTTFGGYVRWSCYRALGRFFTFELSIRKDHKLITSGPYALVRHPSYTGVISGAVGTLLLHLSKGSWIREYALSTTFGQLMVGFWVVSAVFFAVLMCGRTIKEDKGLRAEFGEQWNMWAKEVPWRMIPYVY